jgi:ribosomal protein S18 acetylase RimI-like enzyme
MITIHTAQTLAESAVIRTIVKAFSADPVARWIYPDTEQYLVSFPSFVEVFAGAAFEHESVDLVDDDAAAALWLPPGVHPDEGALSELLERTIDVPRKAGVFELFAEMDRRHPAEPHWYLPMIGVVPEKQGNGYGSLLLDKALKRCDAVGALAYLEASSARSVPLYQRHGFEVLGTIRVDSSPPLFSMVRKPVSKENVNGKDKA